MIVLALDAIQDPVSLFEPVYNDDGDPIYVMDQIRDMKNTDGEMDRKSIPFGGDEKIISQGTAYTDNAFHLKEKRRWKLLVKSLSARRRFPVWKRMR